MSLPTLGTVTVTQEPTTPTATDGTATIHVDNFNDTNMEIKVTDAQGNDVSSVSATYNSATKNIELSGLSSGQSLTITITPKSGKT